MFEKDFDNMAKALDRKSSKMFGWVLVLAILGAVMGLGFTGVIIWAIIRLVGKF